MHRLTWRNLVATRGRLVLTVLAVVLGTGFISAAGTVGAILSNTFGLSDDVELADVTVAGESDFEGGAVQPPALDDATVEAVREVEGVSGVDLGSSTTVVAAAADGTRLDGLSGNAVAFVPASIWPTDAVTGEVELADGRAPEAPGEVVLDRATVERRDLALGDEVVLTSLAAELRGTLVGVTAPAEDDLDLEIVVPYVTYEDAQALAGRPGADFLSVGAEDGVSQDELRGRIEAVLPEGAAATTGEEERAELEAANASSTRITQAVLAGFAVVALLVGSFLVGNTFNMVIAQRQRQLALLRAIGATRRQVRRSVLLEAFLVSLLSAVAGALLGILGGWGLVGLIDVLTGGDLPPTTPAVDPWYTVGAVAAGVVIGVVAATVAARRATSIPPVAALAEAGMSDTAPRPQRVRLVLGLLLVAGAVALLAAAIAEAGPLLLLVGAGAVLGIVALVVLNPILARVLAPAVHRLFPGTGGAARVARRNTSRNPRRVAGTASAMLIGLTVVVTAMVLASSVQASLGGQFERALDGSDVVVYEGTGVPAPTLATLEGLPEVAAVGGVAVGSVQVEQADDAVLTAAAVTPGIDPLVDTGDPEGTRVGELGRDEVAMSREALERFGVAVGDTLDVAYPSGGTAQWAVVGSYDSTIVLEGLTVTAETLADSGNQPGFSQVFVAAAEGVSPDAAVEAIDGALAAGQGTPQTVADRSDELSATVDQLLVIVFVLLGVTLLIALLGVVNTTVLSTLERTREFGMLRAIGTTRPQLRSAVRRETVAITLYGALTGVAAGLVIGVVTVLALRNQDIDVLSIPWLRIAVVLVVALVAGVLAAALPARRAARLDVLQALHTV